MNEVRFFHKEDIRSIVLNGLAGFFLSLGE